MELPGSTGTGRALPIGGARAVGRSQEMHSRHNSVRSIEVRSLHAAEVHNRSRNSHRPGCSLPAVKPRLDTKLRPDLREMVATDPHHHRCVKPRSAVVKIFSNARSNPLSNENCLRQAG